MVALDRSTSTPQRWAYPLLLLFMCLTILMVFSVWLIQIFREMFEEFGLSLPAPTQIAIWFTDQLTVHALRTVLVSIVSLAILIPIVRLWRGRALTNRLFGRVVAGTSSNLRAMSRLIATLAELLQLGAPVPDAIRMAGDTCGHAMYQNSTLRLASMISNGATRLDDVRAETSLPRLLLRALFAGPSSTPNIALLRELAVMYEARAASRGEILSTVFPAIAVLLVGAFVGFVFIVLFMPLVSMVTSLA